MAGFTIRVEAHFEAAHFLRSYRGEPEPLHGHSYKVEAELTRAGGTLDREDIAVDFVFATKTLHEVARGLDYKCINDVAPFDKQSPSAENIAQWFHRELSAAVAREGAVVNAIIVWEGPFHSVRYEP